jgi:hypothetical protein
MQNLLWIQYLPKTYYKKKKKNLISIYKNWSENGIHVIQFREYGSRSSLL